MRASKRRTSRRREGRLSVRSAALLQLTLQRLMSQCWPQSLNGSFLRQMIDFSAQNLFKGFFHSHNFCYIFTKQSIIRHGSSRAAQRWHCSANLASFPESNEMPLWQLRPVRYLSIISTFSLVPVISFMSCKEKKGKLFSCLIWKLVICQKWLFDCVSSLDANPQASKLASAAKASAHDNSTGYVNVCLAPSIFAGPLAAFNHRRW